MKILCMSFDGETQLERPTFQTVDDTWEYASDLGSKWYFYPFYFVVTDSGKTIKDAPYPLDVYTGCRVKTVKKLFKTASAKPEAEGMTLENFMFFVTSEEAQS